MSKKRYSKNTSVAIVFIIYLLCLFLFNSLFFTFALEPTILNLFIVDILATVLVFGFSALFSNSSIYDPYWSVIPIFIVWILWRFNNDGLLTRQILIVALVMLWGIRLTTNFLIGWKGLNHEDWRYGMLKEKTGRLYWVVSFLGIHLFPTVIVFLGISPLWYVMQSTQALNLLDLLAGLITLTAIVIEWLADEQLRKNKPHLEKNEYMNKGLWAYCRHPNYLGEIGFWFGLSLFLWSSYSYQGYWTIVGFIAMVLLFTIVSIPMMDRRNKSRRKNYDEYIIKVPALIPKIRK